MKCDELKPITVTDECGSYSVYSKSDVDTVIEEKDRTIEFAKALTLKDIEIIKKKDKEIAELKDELRWRKFPDEKPEEWETVVVRLSDGFYDLAVYLSNGQGWDIGDGFYHKSEEVTHWSPLPSAPKEEK